MYKNNAKGTEKIATRGSKLTMLFEVGNIVSLKVNCKYRLLGETVRLPYRIIYIQNGLFQLLTTISILQSYY